MGLNRPSRTVRVFPFLIVVCFVISPAQAQYSGGSGTADDPYQIATAEDLVLLGETPEDYGKHFILTADIDLDPNLPGRKVFDRAVIAPSRNDNAYSDPRAFHGVFDGNGFIISNLTIQGQSYLGLFGELRGDGDVSNLILEKVDICGTGRYVGGLVGMNSGSVSECSVEGVVTGQDNVGGLIGMSYGPVSRCYATADVVGFDGVGGLTGWNNYGDAINCYAAGNVVGNSCVGGLVGANSKRSEAPFVLPDIIYCYSVGTVTGVSSVGGLVGCGNERGVHLSYWNIETSGQSSSAGGRGKTDEEMRSVLTFLSFGCDPVWTIRDGIDYPRLAWENKPGEVITARLSDFIAGSGEPNDPYQIFTAEQLNTIGLLPCEFDKHFKLMADIDLRGYVGTEFNLIGQEQSYRAFRPTTPFTGVFDGNGHKILNLRYSSEAYGAVGLFPSVSDPNAVIKNLGLVDSIVIASNGEYVGALVGHMFEGRIVNCYVQGGIVFGRNYVGGLVGANRGTVAECYSSCNVFGDYSVGGMAGSSSSGTMAMCYSVGTVMGRRDAGGFVSMTNNNSILEACFWNIVTSGQLTSDGGSGLSTTEMQTASTFLEAGWDFIHETENGADDIWWILEGQDYPRLWWELLSEN